MTKADFLIAADLLTEHGFETQADLLRAVAAPMPPGDDLLDGRWECPTITARTDGAEEEWDQYPNPPPLSVIRNRLLLEFDLSLVKQT